MLCRKSVGGIFPYFPSRTSKVWVWFEGSRRELHGLQKAVLQVQVLH